MSIIPCTTFFLPNHRWDMSKAPTLFTATLSQCGRGLKLPGSLRVAGLRTQYFQEDSTKTHDILRDAASRPGIKPP